MDKVIQRSLAQVTQSSKYSFPWKPDHPWSQDFFLYVDGSWVAQQPAATRSSEVFNTLALYSWNIDFMLPYADSRMQQALKTLKNMVSASSGAVTIIFFQECTQSNLTLLASHDWIRESFYLTDLDTNNWTSGHYGTVTLVDKRLSVANCFRVHYEKTRMERDAFFTDICMGNDAQIVRLCNSHLESMAFMPAMRPHQVALASDYMHEVPAAVIAGDFNAIQDFDRQLHSDNNLKDAYLELGGTEDSEEGYTWGQQASTALREQFGCCRMDKVFYCGELTLESFERFGGDVMVVAENERADIVALGFEKPWITDHLGVKVVFKL